MNRVVTVLALLMASAAPVMAAPAPRAPVSAPVKAVELPIVLAGTQILVDGVRVNGKGPYRFLLDTGAQGHGRADATLVAELGLPAVGEAQAGDGGGNARRTLAMHRVERLELGPLSFRDLELPSRDYNAGGAGAQRGPIAGVLGIELFRGALMTVDYGRQVLRIEPGASLPAGPGVLALAPGAPVPTVSLTLGGEALQAHLDTGSMAGVTVGPDTAARLSFPEPPAVVGKARTVSGEFELKRGRIAGALELGGVRVEDPTVEIMPRGEVANLGGRFLSGYVLTLDLAHDRAKLTPQA